MKTVEKTVKILNYLSEGNQELGVTEISNALHFHKSTTHGILMSLKNEGYIISNPDTKKYSLGFKILELAEHIIYKKNLIDICLPLMKDFASSIQEDVSLNIRNQNKRVCIALSRGPQQVRLNITPGMSIPIHCGAAGKCLLAYLPEKKKIEIINAAQLEKYTSFTITSADILFKQLNEIKIKGYSESREEYFNEAAAMAFPLFDKSGSIIASYSIHSTVNRLKEKRRDFFIAQGLKTTQRTNVLLKEINY